MKLTHKHTLAASYLGYITQAVVNNLTPLLFVVFETSLGISIGRISLLITVNFGVQMLVDLLSDRKSTRLNSSHGKLSRMPSSA